ncbi:MAG TPA: AsmA family protein, partial [Dongiaceae bacterium]
MLKKILIGVFALIVLLVAAIAVGPRFVNWNSYKGKVAEEVRAATGRDLAIDGDMSLSLLPSPALSVSGVRLANLPGGSAPDMARLKSLEVHVALVPLLSGKIQVTSVTLVEPVVLLERLASGEANWQFAPPPAPGTTSGTAGSGSPSATAPSGPAAQISVDNFTIENGTVLYRAGGIEQKLEGLDATVVMRSLTGPFTATGQAKLVGLPAKFDLAIDSLAGSGPIPMRGTLNVAGDAVVVSFDGSADQTAAAVKGKIGAKLSDPALVFKSAGFQNLPAGLAQPFTLSADLDASAADIALANLTLSLGDTSASGKIDFQPGSPTQGSINLAFSRLDLDKLMPAATSTPAATTTAPTTTTTTAPGGGGFAMPGQVVVNFDLSAEAVAWHQGVVTRPHLTGRLADGQLQIKQASALLPGGSDVSLAGTLASKDGMPQFAGAIQAKSNNLRDLVNWLGAPLPRVSPDRLRSLTLTSRLIAGPTQIELADLDMRLDASHIQGGVTVALPGGARTKPAFGIGLTIDQLDADAYMPPRAAGGGSTTGASTTGTAAGGKPASPLAGLSSLADLEANFDLRAGTLSYNGQAMRGLHLQGTLFGGKLAITDASAKDIGGGQGSIAGSIVNLAKDPHYDLKVNVAAQDAARVLQIAGLGRPAPGQYGALKLNGAVKGGADDVAFDVSFAVTGPGVEGAAKGTAQGLGAGVPRVDSTLSIAAKNTAALFQILGLSRPGMDKLGAVALTGKATSGKDSLDFDLALTLPGIGGKGALKGRLTGLSATPQVATDLKLDAAQPAPLLALAGVSGTTASKLGALGLAGHLEGSANAMKLALTLTALGGNAAINGNVAAAKAPIAFDVTLSASHGDFGSLLAALGKPAPRNAGPLALNVHLSGDAKKFTVKDLSLKAGDGDLSGNAMVDMSGSRLQFAATFASSNFNAA